MNRWWLFLLLWAGCGLLISPVWERIGIYLGVDPIRYAPGADLYRFPSSNDAANLATIQALVEDHTWAIDATLFDTADKARLGNRTYSVRPPMLATLASMIYAVLFVGGFRFASDPGTCHWWLVWLTSGLAVAVGGWAVARCVDLLSGGRRRGTLAGLCYCFGTMALPYALAVNHHVTAAGALALALLAILKVDVAAPRNPGRTLLAAGFCAGLAATFDLAGGGVFAAASLVWTLSSPSLRNRAWAFVIGSCIPIAIHFALNWSITGDFKPLLVRPDAIAASGSTLRLDELSGIAKQRSWSELASYLGGLLVDSKLDDFRPRGLLLYCPLTFFALISGVTALVSSNGSAVRFAAAWMGASVMLLAYLTVYTNNFAGNCLGIRWFVILMPCIITAVFSGATRRGTIGNVIFIAAWALGAYFGIAGLSHGPWHPLAAPAWLTRLS